MAANNLCSDIEVGDALRVEELWVRQKLSPLGEERAPVRNILLVIRKVDIRNLLLNRLKAGIDRD